MGADMGSKGGLVLSKHGREDFKDDGPTGLRGHYGGLTDAHYGIGVMGKGHRDLTEEGGYAEFNAREDNRKSIEDYGSAIGKFGKHPGGRRGRFAYGDDNRGYGDGFYGGVARGYGYGGYGGYGRGYGYGGYGGYGLYGGYGGYGYGDRGYGYGRRGGFRLQGGKKVAIKED